MTPSLHPSQPLRRPIINSQKTEGWKLIGAVRGLYVVSHCRVRSPALEVAGLGIKLSSEITVPARTANMNIGFS